MSALSFSDRVKTYWLSIGITRKVHLPISSLSHLPVDLEALSKAVARRGSVAQCARQWGKIAEEVGFDKGMDKDKLRRFYKKYLEGMEETGSQVNGSVTEEFSLQNGIEDEDPKSEVEQAVGGSGRKVSRKRKAREQDVEPNPDTFEGKFLSCSDANRKEPRAMEFVDKMKASLSRRLSRAFSQRIYLIMKSEDFVSNRGTYTIMGSTGNVYTVTIGSIVSCTCPDPYHHCKHILFVKIKVLKIPQESYLVYQNAFVPNELVEIFRHAAENNELDASVIASERVRQVYSSTMGLDVVEKIESEKRNIRKSFEGEDCPICYEEMTIAQDDSKLLSWCEHSCGKNYHKECIDCLKKHAGAKASCPMCRAELDPRSAPNLHSASSSGVNLAAVAAGRSNEPQLGWRYNAWLSSGVYRGGSYHEVSE